MQVYLTNIAPAYKLYGNGLTRSLILSVASTFVFALHVSHHNLPDPRFLKAAIHVSILQR